MASRGHIMSIIVPKVNLEEIMGIVIRARG